MAAWQKYAYIPVAAAGLLVAIGLIVQTRTELEEAVEAREAEPKEETRKDAPGGKALAKGADQDRAK